MTTSPGLVSIGYEGRTAEGLLGALVDAGVDVVVDVRLTPLSRKPGLSKTRLAEALNAAGVEYIHLRALGNPRDNREPFWNGSLATGVARFRELLQEPEPVACLEQVAEMVSTKRVAVLCFEREHERCHRQVVTMRSRGVLRALRSRSPSSRQSGAGSLVPTHADLSSGRFCTRPRADTRGRYQRA